MKIDRFDAAAILAARAQLADLLLDAVAGGAALGFPMSVDSGQAREYWREIAAEARAGRRLLLAATHQGTLVGTVQLALCQASDGRGRAEVQQMMVHSRARRRGLGGVLLRAVEAEANALGRGLLFLDTEAGSAAEQLYHGLGYNRVDAGVLPVATYSKALLAPVAV